VTIRSHSESQPVDLRACGSKPGALGVGDTLESEGVLRYALVAGEPVSHTRFKPSISIVR
jgi:hypothetical protein